MTRPTRAEDLHPEMQIQFGLLDDWLHLVSVTFEAGRVVIEGVVFPDRLEDRGYTLISVAPSVKFLVRTPTSQE